MSAVVVPFGAFVEFAEIVISLFVQIALLNSSEYVNKFQGTSSTNPAEFMRVPSDALVNERSPEPSCGTTDFTKSSSYIEGDIINDAFWSNPAFINC